jgi:hypothetical protein
MLDPVPRRFHRVRLPVSSSVVIGLPQRRLGSAFPRLSANHDFSRPVFSRLQIFLNVPASKFARPPDRLYRCAYCRRAAGAFTSGQYRASLPLHAPDMLTVRIQAIDSTRTFTLLDSQPCRLLTFAPRSLPASPLLWAVRLPQKKTNLAGIPGSSAYLSLRAAPNHPGEPDGCIHPLLHHRWQASSASTDWPLPLG